MDARRSPRSLAPYAPVASPCINICRMNEATGWCEGCLRTLPEIAAWGSQNDDQRRAVLAQLPLRQDRWRALQAGQAGRETSGPSAADADAGPLSERAP